MRLLINAFVTVDDEIGRLQRLTIDTKTSLCITPERQHSNTSGAVIDHDAPLWRKVIRVVGFGQSPDIDSGFGEHRNIDGMPLDIIPSAFTGTTPTLRSNKITAVGNSRRDHAEACCRLCRMVMRRSWEKHRVGQMIATMRQNAIGADQSSVG